MLKSMTGYGRGEYEQDQRKFLVEVKTVNHRYLDISVKMPKMFNFMEDRIRKEISRFISRGKTDIYINFESGADEDVHLNLNETLAAAYMDKLVKLESALSLSGPDKLSLIAKFPEVITIEKEVADENFMWEIFKPALCNACEALVSMRMKEGASLEKDLLEKLVVMESLVSEIALRVPEMIEQYRNKLKEKVSELLENAEVDESRLLLEVTLFAEKASVDEELTRLKSHIDQMREIFKEDVPVGRKLDFLVQEMNREANTIASKANDLVISKTALSLKSEIEKIREQIQNIE